VWRHCYSALVAASPEAANPIFEIGRKEGRPVPIAACKAKRILLNDLSIRVAVKMQALPFAAYDAGFTATVFAYCHCKEIRRVA